MRDAERGQPELRQAIDDLSEHGATAKHFELREQRIDSPSERIGGGCHRQLAAERLSRVGQPDRRFGAVRRHAPQLEETNIFVVYYADALDSAKSVPLSWKQTVTRSDLPLASTTDTVTKPGPSGCHVSERVNG